jgi:acetyltransferase-like isoleucine patch superfamily enzyme
LKIGANVPSPKSIIKKIRNRNKFSKIKAMVNCNLHPSSWVDIERLKPCTGCSLTIGDHSMVEGHLVFERPNAVISIGRRTFVNGSLIASTQIEIGDDVLIAWGVSIVDHDSHAISFSERSRDVENWMEHRKDWTYVNTAPVYIDSKSWIGFNAIILKGVHVGEGSIVGAGSVVARDVAPWTIVAGNPARVVREIAENER